LENNFCSEIEKMQSSLVISFIALAGFASSQDAHPKPLALPDRGPAIRRVQPGAVPRPVINCDDDLINGEFRR